MSTATLALITLFAVQGLLVSLALIVCKRRLLDKALEATILITTTSAGMMLVSHPDILPLTSTLMATNYLAVLMRCQGHHTDQSQAHTRSQP